MTARPFLVGAVGAVLVAALPAAEADPCHGPGGGSSSSSSGGDSHVATGSICTEVSDVVGRRRCGGFGAGWAEPARRPPLVAEVGFFTRRLDTGFQASGAMAHETESFAYQVAARPDRDTAVGANLRVGAALPGHLYVAADFELGGLVSGDSAAVQMAGAEGGASPSMAASQTLYGSAGGAAGVQGQVGPAVLAAEVVAGARMTSLSVDSRLGSCALSDTHRHYAGFVEPRIRIGLWVTPWITVGGFAGSDLVGDSKMVGASLAFHLRAFDRGR